MPSTPLASPPVANEHMQAELAQLKMQIDQIFRMLSAAAASGVKRPLDLAGGGPEETRQRLCSRADRNWQLWQEVPEVFESVGDVV